MILPIRSNLVRHSRSIPGSFWKGRSVFITGAAGFVGSWLSEELCRQGARFPALVWPGDEEAHWRPLLDFDGVEAVKGYVEDAAGLERILRDARELETLGVHVVAIMSNDPTDYPEDSFDSMKQIAAEFKFPFPYLYDETQAVAKAFGAVCTPDFFGYNADLKLQYRGRLDA